MPKSFFLGFMLVLVILVLKVIKKFLYKNYTLATTL